MRAFSWQCAFRNMDIWTCSISLNLGWTVFHFIGWTTFICTISLLREELRLILEGQYIYVFTCKHGDACFEIICLFTYRPSCNTCRSFGKLTYLWCFTGCTSTMYVGLVYEGENICQKQDLWCVVDDIRTLIVSYSQSWYVNRQVRPEHEIM